MATGPVYASVSFVLISLVLLASYPPARRAARIDPLLCAMSDGMFTQRPRVGPARPTSDVAAASTTEL
jgi:hypothetical protein